MSAAEALGIARAAGIDVRLDRDDLVLEASAPPPTETLDVLSRHKLGIVALLRPGRDGRTAQDWWLFFETRASTAEVRDFAPEPEFRCLIEGVKDMWRAEPSHQAGAAARG